MHIYGRESIWFNLDLFASFVISLRTLSCFIFSVKYNSGSSNLILFLSYTTPILVVVLSNLINHHHELDFKKLVNEPEAESKKLMKFCELPWDMKCLEFYKRKDLLSKTTSNIQIRKAINKGSVNKYLPYKQLLIKYGEKYNWFS